MKPLIWLIQHNFGAEDYIWLVELVKVMIWISLVSVHLEINVFQFFENLALWAFSWKFLSGKQASTAVEIMHATLLTRSNTNEANWRPSHGLEVSKWQNCFSSHSVNFLFIYQHSANNVVVGCSRNLAYQRNFLILQGLNVWLVFKMFWLLTTRF